MIRNATPWIPTIAQVDKLRRERARHLDPMPDVGPKSMWIDANRFTKPAYSCSRAVLSLSPRCSLHVRQITFETVREHPALPMRGLRGVVQFAAVAHDGPGRVC